MLIEQHFYFFFNFFLGVEDVYRALPEEKWCASNVRNMRLIVIHLRTIFPSDLQKGVDTTTPILPTGIKYQER